MLRESEHVEEQGDILQYLIDTKGQNYDTGSFEILKLCIPIFFGLNFWKIFIYDFV